MSDAPLRPLRGGVSGLRVFVSNPRLLFDLQFFLRRIGCATSHAHSHELEVEVPGAPSDAQGRREVELYLALWHGRKQVSDVEAYVVEPRSPVESSSSSCVEE